MNITLCRAFHFNAAHRLHNPHWTDEQNREVFGKCNNANYHGHNYQLIVKITGAVDPETGYVMDMRALKDIVEANVIERFDHKSLNLDTKEFEHLNPTAEHIAYVIYNVLRPMVDGDKKITIVLYETERNFVEYTGD
ncbi:6-carboxytetrahydropterin synthase [Mucilaginibacter mali]|uniref:6-carboxy-5,6,7,8-tetrahydropterin synthase n=1 Tax=Mucilaginibacter mali TaxID=2740462 RepID=A0A7D4UPF5_9SPHI|nr:6-carboxytetrahydropterin synthase [Mucilaginibacter mali]